MGAGQTPHADVPEILVVDAAGLVHAALSLQLADRSAALIRVRDAADCLERLADRAPALIVVDLGAAPPAGLALLRELRARRCPAPVLAAAAHASVRLAVEAMKSGAADVFEWPLEFGRMLAGLGAILGMAEPPAGPGAVSESGRSPLEALTRREQEVLAQIAGGASNKEVGRLLGISPRTVEVHRARIMEKLGARNAADLVRIVLSEPRP